MQNFFTSLPSVNGILHAVSLCCTKILRIPIHHTKLCFGVQQYVTIQKAFVYLVLALPYDSRFVTGDFDLYILPSSHVSLQWTKWTILNYIFAVSVLFTL